MRVLSELVLLPLTGAQLFQLQGAPVLFEQRAVGTSYGGLEVVPSPDLVYTDARYQTPYYTATEDVDGGAGFSAAGLMAVAAISAAGFAVGRSIALNAVAAEARPAVPMVNAAGEAAGEAELTLRVGKNPESFGHIVHRKLVLERRNARHGTANTKTRSEVRGGGRKPYQQKGTGRARRGSTRSPLIVGGGVTFGPKPKNWANKKMNKKEARLAISLALQSRAGSMTVVKDLENALSAPRTVEMHALLRKLGVGPHENAKGKLEATSVIVSGEHNTLYVATKNIPYIKLLRADQLSVYDLLRPAKLLVSERALAAINEQYGAAQAGDMAMLGLAGGAAADDMETIAEEDGFVAGADNVDDSVDEIIDEMEEMTGDAPEEP
jgi:large subunit ribosomal protein L4